MPTSSQKKTLHLFVAHELYCSTHRIQRYLSNQNNAVRKHSEVALKLAFPIIWAEQFLWASCQAQSAMASGTLTKGEFPNLCSNTDNNSNTLIRKWSLLESSIIKHCYIQQNCSLIWPETLWWAVFP